MIAGLHIDMPDWFDAWKELIIVLALAVISITTLIMVTKALVDYNRAEFENSAAQFVYEALDGSTGKARRCRNGKHAGQFTCYNKYSSRDEFPVKWYTVIPQEEEDASIE